MLGPCVRRIREKDHFKLFAFSVAACVFLAFVFAAAGIIQALEEGNERDNLFGRQQSWDDTDVRRRAVFATLLDHLNASRPDLLSNATWLNSEMQSALGSRPTEFNWTFSGSLYFVFTIVTTIGYGTFAPLTSGGRAFTVFLAIIGTAFFAYFVSQASGAFTALLDYLAKSCCKQKSTRVRLTLDFVAVIGYWLIAAAIFEALAEDAGESWTYGTSMYYAAITFTTVGLGGVSNSRTTADSLHFTLASHFTPIPHSTMP